jgi:hypothetical protein
MSLIHYGVTQDSRIFLSVKDAETGAVSATSVPSSSCPDSGPAQTSSPSLDLQKELRCLLLRHFAPADAEKVLEEFSQVSACMANCQQSIGRY